MAIGLGVLLIVLGLVLVLDVVNVDTSAVDMGTLGWILLVAGVLVIVISLIVNQQRTRRTVVDERLRRSPPPLNRERARHLAVIAPHLPRIPGTAESMASPQASWTSARTGRAPTGPRR